MKTKEKTKKVVVGKSAGVEKRRRRLSNVQFLVVAVLVGIAGVTALLLSFAATAANIYISPASSNVQQGNNFTVALRINPNGASTDTVAATVTYDATKMQFVSADSTGSPYSQSFYQTTTSNSITFSRNIDPSASYVTTDSLIANITFKAVAGSGTSALTISSQNATYNGSNLAPTATNGTINFTSPPPPTVSLSNFPANTIVSTDLSIASGQTNAQLNSSTYQVAAVPVDNSGAGIKQVDVQVDSIAGTKVTLTSGFGFSVNMTGLSCGAHNLVVTVTDNAVSPKSSTITVPFTAAKAADIDANCLANDTGDYSAIYRQGLKTASQLTNPRVDVDRNGTVENQDISRVIGAIKQPNGVY